MIVIVIEMTTLIPKMKNIGSYLFKTSKIIEIEPMTAENGRIKKVDIHITGCGPYSVLCLLIISYSTYLGTESYCQRELGNVLGHFEYLHSPKFRLLSFF